MAETTDSSCRPEIVAFQRCFHVLKEGLKYNLTDLVPELFSRGLVTGSNRDRALLPATIADERATNLLPVLESRFLTDTPSFSTFLDVLDSFPALQYLGKKVKEEYARVRKLDCLDILVCGRTGVGKSSLINFMIGKDLVSVGDRFGTDEVDFCESMTKETSPYVVPVNGVLLRIFDSPGLQDGTDNDEAYLQEMHDKCGDVDLVFYCHELIARQWTRRELEAIRLLTEKFGAGFWKKAILVLTKANMVLPQGSEEKQDCFKRLLFMNGKVIKTEIIRKFTPTGVADDVPVVAVGSASAHVLPDGESFVPKLKHACLQRVSGVSRKKFEKASEAIFTVTG